MYIVRNVLCIISKFLSTLDNYPPKRCLRILAFKLFPKYTQTIHTTECLYNVCDGKLALFLGNYSDLFHDFWWRLVTKSLWCYGFWRWNDIDITHTHARIDDTKWWAYDTKWLLAYDTNRPNAWRIIIKTEHARWYDECETIVQRSVLCAFSTFKGFNHLANLPISIFAFRQKPHFLHLHWSRNYCSLFTQHCRDS